MGLKTPTGNWTRSTPRRGPDFVHATVKATTWHRLSMPTRSNALRAKQREKARTAAQMMHDMLRSIGHNPVYNGSPRGSAAERIWAKAAKAWLEANQKRYVVA